MKAGIDYIGVSVGALIVNEKGEILLLKRSQNAKNEKGCWEAPGGAIEYNERLQDAIKREMQEELGIDIEIVRQFPAKDHIIPNEKQHWVATTFLCKIVENQVPKIQEPHKHDAIGWFALKNFPKPLSIITQLDREEYIQNYS